MYEMENIGSRAILPITAYLKPVFIHIAHYSPSGPGNINISFANPDSN